MEDYTDDGKWFGPADLVDLVVAFGGKSSRARRLLFSGGLWQKLRHLY